MTAEPKVVRKAVTVAKGEAEEEDETGKWDGKSIPKKKEEYLGLPDEASHWEVEEARVEVSTLECFFHGNSRESIDCRMFPPRQSCLLEISMDMA